MKRLSFVLLFVLVFPLLIAVPVSAAPPVFESGGFTEDSAVFDVSPCDFEVRNYEVASYRQTSYFDNEGNLVRVRLHLSGTDRVYNAENPEFFLTGSYVGNGEVDLETGEIVFATALPWHITAPGYGTVLVRAGRWLRYPDSQFAGRDSFVIASDIAQLCEALGGAPAVASQAAVGAVEPPVQIFLPTVISGQ